MNTDKLAELLVVLAEGEAADLMPAIAACCETDDERAAIEEGGSSALLDLLPSRGLLFFSWASWGAPTSSSDSMYLLTAGGRYFVCMPEDMDGLHPFLVLGYAAAGEEPVGVSAIVREQMPRLFGACWTCRLPTSTTNTASDLLPAEVLRDTYRVLAEDPTVWDELISDLGFLVSPFERGPVAPTAAVGEMFDEGQRRLIFDRWFTLTYREEALGEQCAT